MAKFVCFQIRNQHYKLATIGDRFPLENRWVFTLYWRHMSVLASQITGYLTGYSTDVQVNSKWYIKIRIQRLFLRKRPVMQNTFPFHVYWGSMSLIFQYGIEATLPIACRLPTNDSVSRRGNLWYFVTSQYIAIIFVKISFINFPLLSHCTLWFLHHRIW